MRRDIVCFSGFFVPFRVNATELYKITRDKPMTGNDL